MKKFAIIHHSYNFMDGQWIHRFDTEKEALDYVKDFRGTTDWHKDDQIEVVEIKDTFSAEVVDETSTSKTYGFKLKS